MQELSIDLAFSRFVGQFGKGQRQLFFLVSCFWCCVAIHTILPIFLLLDPIREGYWACNEGVECSNVVDPCTLPRTDWHWTHKNYSLQSEFDLVCEHQWKTEFVNSLFFVGFFFGAGYFGTLSDRIGRKRVLFLSTAQAFTFGLLCAAAPNFITFCVLRTACGFGVSGIGLATAVLTTEWVGPDYRSAAGICSHYLYPVGVTVLCLLAYWNRSWRLLQAEAACLAFLPLLAYRHIDESPRWLLIKGRMMDATKLLQKMSRINGTRVPDAPLAEPRVNAKLPPASLRSMLDHRVLTVRLAIMLFLWMGVASAYFGVNFELGHLSGSLYMNTFLSFVVEFPSLFLAYILIDQIGRSATLSLCFLQSGVCCALSAATTGTLQSVGAILGKFGCSAAFTLLSLYCQEMFPTVVRNSVLGAASLSARVGGILAPQYALVAEVAHSEALPFYIFGALLLASGWLTLYLPETRGQPMPDTFQDAVKGSGDGRAASTGWDTVWRAPRSRSTGVEILRGKGGALATHRAKPVSATTADMA